MEFLQVANPSDISPHLSNFLLVFFYSWDCSTVRSLVKEGEGMCKASNTWRGEGVACCAFPSPKISLSTLTALNIGPNSFPSPLANMHWGSMIFVVSVYIGNIAQILLKVKLPATLVNIISTKPGQIIQDFLSGCPWDNPGTTFWLTEQQIWLSENM